MMDLLIMGGCGIALYIFYKWMLKEPILPWKEKSEVNIMPIKKKRRKKDVQLDEEPKLFEELFSDVQDISNHMIRFKDNTFSLIAEVEPVNYFLKSQSEQEAIDEIYEGWTATITDSISIYLQNRFIDISEPIEQMQKNMREAEDLNDAAYSFGQNMIQELIKWQKSSPRYETKRYIIFSHKVNIHDINADSKEELEERLVEKTFSELYRRYSSTKAQLQKAGIGVSMLPTEGIYELLYYTFNRRRAVKVRFKDIVKQERNALYITADQTDEHIEGVKEVIRQNEDKNEMEKGKTA